MLESSHSVLDRVLWSHFALKSMFWRLFINCLFLLNLWVVVRSSSIWTDFHRMFIFIFMLLVKHFTQTSHQSNLRELISFKTLLSLSHHFTFTGRMAEEQCSWILSAKCHPSLSRLWSAEASSHLLGTVLLQVGGFLWMNGCEKVQTWMVAFYTGAHDPARCKVVENSAGYCL